MNNLNKIRIKHFYNTIKVLSRSLSSIKSEPAVDETHFGFETVKETEKAQKG